ncbi:MAG: Aminopeptidase YpdF (MP-, MA-, MS-, AP-, NP-specific), partial [uncultured Friedmanniella sp.]
LHRPADPPRRPGLLRHHPLLQRLPDLLLPDLRGGQLDPGPARRLHQGARVDGPRHRRHQGRCRNRRGGRTAPGRRGVRLRQRDGGVRSAVRPRPRAGPARAPDHLAAQLPQGADRAPGRDGVRARDLLPRLRRLLGRADRGGDRHHRGRPPGPHPLPRAGPRRHQPLL